MAGSLVGLFGQTVERRGDAPAARHTDGQGTWWTRSWRELADDVRLAASGLIELGVEPGQRINILANSSYRWMVADLAIQSAGAVPVAIYQSNLPHEVEYIANDCASSGMFVENADQLAKLREVRDKLPAVRHAIAMDETSGDGVLTWSELESRGRGALERNAAEIERRSAALGPDDVLTLIYTSGTTGPPKGVVLTHANLLYVADATVRAELVGEDSVQLLFLPMAHSFARCLQAGWIGTGHELAIDADTGRIVSNLPVVKPTVMASVPRIFEKVYATVTSQGLGAGGAKGALFRWALGLNDRVSQHASDGTPVPLGVSLQMGLARRLVFSSVGSRLSELFGGRLEFFISGGAPLSPTMHRFFDNAGVTILEGYGLTETSAAAFVNRPERYKIGTVGPAIEGTEARIANDGEVLIRGPGVMRGYHNREDATREVLSDDGWFATGDIGELDADGYLKITDRKKDIIVTAGGKNVAPQNIEGQLKAASPLISQVMVYGDQRKYLSALVTLDPEKLAAHAAEHGLSGDYAELTQNKDVESAIQSVFDQVNASLASYETIKRFAILDRDFEVGDELTPTLKVKRKHASQKYLDLLETLYS